MQTFYINSGSTNPTLRMEIINDGRFDFAKFYNAIQDAVITFSMKNVDTDILKVSNAPADLVLSEESGCEDRYFIAYQWKERDVKSPGTYKGWFNIKFNGNIYEEGVSYPTGNLIVPIVEELIIEVK